jgi:hypothetical protein
MTVNNSPLYDAVIAAVMQQRGVWLTDPYSALYTAQANIAVAVATEVDSLIPTIAGGVTISQRVLMQSVTKNILAGASPQSTTPGDYTTIATAIVGEFVAFSTKLQSTETTKGKQIEVDFGTVPVDLMVFTITDSDITTSSKIIGSLAYVAPTGRSLDELEFVELNLEFGAGAGSAPLYAQSLNGPVEGKYKINYVVSSG